MIFTQAVVPVSYIKRNFTFYCSPARLVLSSARSGHSLFAVFVHYRPKWTIEKNVRAMSLFSCIQQVNTAMAPGYDPRLRFTGLRQEVIRAFYEPDLRCFEIAGRL
jgi:hypothetical protein